LSTPTPQALQTVRSHNGAYQKDLTVTTIGLLMSHKMG